MAKRFFSAVALHTRGDKRSSSGRTILAFKFLVAIFRNPSREMAKREARKEIFFWPSLGEDVKNDHRCGWIRFRGSWETAITIVYWYWCDRVGEFLRCSVLGVSLTLNVDIYGWGFRFLVKKLKDKLCIYWTLMEFWWKNDEELFSN